MFRGPGQAAFPRALQDASRLGRDDDAPFTPQPHGARQPGRGRHPPQPRASAHRRRRGARQAPDAILASQLSSFSLEWKLPSIFMSPVMVDSALLLELTDSLRYVSSSAEDRRAIENGRITSMARHVPSALVATACVHMPLCPARPLRPARIVTRVARAEPIRGRAELAAPIQLSQARCIPLSG